MAAGDLATVGKVKDHLGLTSGDDDLLLASYVTRASARFVTECGQPILLGARSEILDGNGGTSLVLSCGPVTAVTSLEVDGEPISEAEGQGDGYVLVGERQLRLRGYEFTRGVANVEVAYTSGYPADAIPPEIEQAVIDLVAWWYRGKEHIGVASTTTAGATTTFQGTWGTEQSQDGLPASFRATARLYRRPGV